MLPHRRVDDSDSDRILVAISARSASFRIERIVVLLHLASFRRAWQLVNIRRIRHSRRQSFISRGCLMRTRLCLFMLLLSLTGATLAYGQGEKKPRTVADYHPRMLKELSTLLPETFRAALAERGVQGNKDMKQIVHGELFPSRVKVVYSGMKRPLLEDKRNLIISWANQFAGMPEFYTVPYQTELLFTEGSEKYWLAVRRELLAHDWKQGDVLELCVIKMGNVRVGDEFEPVLLVEQFIQE